MEREYPIESRAVRRYRGVLMRVEIGEADAYTAKVKVRLEAELREAGIDPATLTAYKVSGGFTVRDLL